MLPPVKLLERQKVGGLTEADGEMICPRLGKIEDY